MARGRRKKKSASNGQPASNTQSSSNGAAASSSTQPVPEDIEVIISAKPPSQEAEAEASMPPKPVPKGLDEAFFERSWSRDDEASGGDWDTYDQIIGTDTTYIGFGSSFQLADRHIDDILALGSSVCENLSEFEFWFEDVSYDARNDAWGVTTEGLVRLARACPGLTRVQLQRTTRIKDAALLAFVEHCPGLVSLEITDGPGQEHSFTERAFDELREHPDWADELDALIISHGGPRRSMKALRRLGRRRPGLTITMVGLCEEKKWGDWELERVETQYRAGREYRPNWGFIYDEDSW